MQNDDRFFDFWEIGPKGAPFVLPGNIQYKLATSRPKEEDGATALTHVTSIIYTKNGFRFIGPFDRKFFGFKVFFEDAWLEKLVYVDWCHRDLCTGHISFALNLAE